MTKKIMMEVQLMSILQHVDLETTTTKYFFIFFNKYKEIEDYSNRIWPEISSRMTWIPILFIILFIMVLLL